VQSCTSGVRAYNNLQNLDYAAISTLLVHDRRLLVPLRCPPGNTAATGLTPLRRRKCDAVQQHIFKILNMRTALKLKISLVLDFLGFYSYLIKTISRPPCGVIDTAQTISAVLLTQQNPSPCVIDTTETISMMSLTQ
jgi:hypothetical protein